MKKLEQEITRVIKCHETEVNAGSLQMLDRLKKIDQLKRQQKQQLDFQRMVAVHSARYL